MRRKKETEAKGLNPVLAVCLCSALGYVLTAAVFLIYAALLTYTNISEDAMKIVVTAAVGVSVVIGGFFVARAIKKRGIVWGVLTGLMYGVLMIITVACFKPDFAPSLKTGIILSLCLCGGGVGGIIGVNFK